MWFFMMALVILLFLMEDQECFITLEMMTMSFPSIYLFLDYLQVILIIQANVINLMKTSYISSQEFSIGKT